MPHPRDVIAPGKTLGKPPKVHHGFYRALCGRQHRGILLCEKWTVVDCANCIRVQHARHDKPSR